jgi:predicted transcriptional regulator
VTTHLAETALADVDVGGDRHDVLFDVLSNARRRFVLAALLTADRSLSHSELATDVVRWETEMASTTGTPTERRDVEISLVHSHLPKMADAGVIDYDPDAGTVRLDGRADRVRTHLQAVASDH